MASPIGDASSTAAEEEETEQPQEIEELIRPFRLQEAERANKLKAKPKRLDSKTLSLL